ncbi:PREDICTED: exocyst complex component 5-like [Acropora digitifera]|uniref:exocyst complex component 5-like n=1 Tax=Acropora digitifera TaxID=70779 RepID=UPI00077B2247|nr:PREDICTED: exocyst complex component 5-like [Acropora digitifera]
MEQIRSIFQQGEFDANEYVERLASTVVGGGSKGGADAFDPRTLSDVFEKTICELTALDEKMQGRINKLEELCSKEQEEHKQKARELETTFKTASGLFQELDDRINYVATKVVHLGDQLEGINTPRSRAIEAQELMKYFDEFANGKLVSSVFKDHYQLHEAANIIQKLSLIAQELPSERFGPVKKSIKRCHDRVEADLIDEFEKAHHEDSISGMRKCAETLLPFKGYSQCIDSFIKQSQRVSYDSQEFKYGNLKLFQESIYMLTNGRFFLMREHLRVFVSLSSVIRARKLGEKLSLYKLGSDSNFLERLRKNLFSRYLSSYIKTELAYLSEKSIAILDKYYYSINHEKRDKATGTGLISQEISKRIPLRMHANSLDSNTETLLSQDVAVSLLQENKMALKRCESVRKVSVFALAQLLLWLQHSSFETVRKISKHINDYLLYCSNRFSFSLLVFMLLLVLPSAEPKVPPEGFFFKVVEQANAIFHLLEKHFTDCVIGLVAASPVYAECVRKKKEVMSMMESKLDSGIDRILTSMSGWCKNILSTEQKKSDFRPEEHGVGLVERTTACARACEFIHSQLSFIQDSLDGKNLESALTEFGTRIHRQIFEHLQQYQYTSIGGMVAICDISEYRTCIKAFKIPLLVKLFDKLYSLTNLLVVQPENLKQVCSEEQLAMLDKAVLQQFVQLRVDYRTAKLSKHFTN